MSKFWKKANKLIPGGNTILSKRPQLWLPKKWPTHFIKTNDISVVDINNKKYTDCVFAVGTNVLGYNNKKIDDSVKKIINSGVMSSLNCKEEVDFAEKILDANRWAGMVKFARSGGEANSIAIRIARCNAKNSNIAFCGYHGWHDWYISSNLTASKSLDSTLIEGINPIGTPNSFINTSFPFKYNDLDGLKKLISEKRIGIIIMEVKRYIEPENNFLNKIRELCSKKNIILIFDECTTGFRENYGGLHQNYKVYPDISMYGKAIGNGYAINAIVGKKDLMLNSKDSFISSTFWGERVGFAAGIATLNEMKRIGSWKIIKLQGQKIIKKWLQIAKSNKINLKIIGIPSIPTMVFEKNNLIYKTLIAQEFLKIKFLASNIFYLSTKHTDKKLNEYFDKLNDIFHLISKIERGEDIKNYLKSDIVNNHFSRLN
jgi:glutamate-1-semialdehyde aminotransferase